MDPFHIPPPPNHGQKGHNAEDYFNQGQSVPQQHDIDMDELDEMLGTHKVSGTKKASSGKKKPAPDKDQKAKKPPKPVEIMHEGYILTKATPPKGESPSWARVGKRPMPFDEIKLQATALSHQKRTGMGPMEQFLRLSENQQGVVNRIIAEKNTQEKAENAEWVLFHVEKVEEDIRTSVWRVGRTCKKLRLVVRRQDAVPKTAAEKKKQSTDPVYEPGEIIDLSEPPKMPKDKDNDDSNSTKNTTKKKKTTNKKKNAALNDDLMVNVADGDNPVNHERQRQHDDQIFPSVRPSFEPQQDHHHWNDGLDDIPGRQPEFADPFAPQTRQQQDPFAPSHRQPNGTFGQQQDRLDPFAPPQRQPNDGFGQQQDRLNPSANADFPPPGAIPIPGYHQQPHPDQNIPPFAPMPPNPNPFLPEVGAPDQWNSQAGNSAWAPNAPAFDGARISTRRSSHSRDRSESPRRSKSRHRREDERNRREASEERSRREASEERHRRKDERDRRKASEERHRRESRDKAKIRSLETKVEKLADKVERWDAGSLPASSYASTDQDELWSSPPSANYDTPPTSPDRAHSRRKPLGSLHQRKDSAYAQRSPPRPKYYQDRRGPRYPDDRVEIQPGRTYSDHERGRHIYPYERPEPAFTHSQPSRPHLQHANTYDDYPPRRRYFKEMPYEEPRSTRRLTDFPQGYDEADFDRRRSGRVDYTRVDGIGRYGREREPMYEDRRGGDRSGRRYSGLGYYP